jgi:hypothetical protein
MESAQILLVSKERSASDLPWSSREVRGWQLETVHNGWEALERVHAGPGPNVVLLDLISGDSDGLHLYAGCAEASGTSGSGAGQPLTMLPKDRGASSWRPGFLIRRCSWQLEIAIQRSFSTRRKASEIPGAN